MVEHDNAVECVCWSRSRETDMNIIDCLENDDDRKQASQKKESMDPEKDKGGMFFVTGSRDKQIFIWYENRLVRKIAMHDNWIKGGIFHKGGRFLASVSDDASLRIWDLKREFRVHLNHLKCHPSFILACDWHTLKPLFVTGGQEGEVYLWECE